MHILSKLNNRRYEAVTAIAIGCLQLKKGLPAKLPAGLFQCSCYVRPAVQ